MIPMAAGKNNFWEDFNKHIDREKNGVWIDIFGARFKMRVNFSTNSEFRKLLQSDEELAQACDGEREDYSQEKLACEVMGKFIVSDWENVPCQSTGENIPFSREKCLEVMRANKDLALELVNRMSIEQVLYEEGLNDTKKN